MKPKPEDTVFGELMAFMKSFRAEPEMVLLVRPEALEDLMAASDRSSNLLMSSIDSIYGYEYRVTDLIEEPYKFVPKSELVVDVLKVRLSP